MTRHPITIRLFHWHNGFGYISLILSLYFYERARPEAINMFNIWMPESLLRGWNNELLSMSRGFAVVGTVLCLLSILLNQINVNMHDTGQSITAILGPVLGLILLLIVF